MLSADVAVTKVKCLAKGQLEDPLDPRRKGGLSLGDSGHFNDLFDPYAGSRERDAQRSERLCCDTLLPSNQSKEEMLRTDNAVGQRAGFLLGHPQPWTLSTTGSLPTTFYAQMGVEGRGEQGRGTTWKHAVLWANQRRVGRAHHGYHCGGL
jgi:hypothetical protein